MYVCIRQTLYQLALAVWTLPFWLLHTISSTWICPVVRLYSREKKKVLLSVPSSLSSFVSSDDDGGLSDSEHATMTPLGSRNRIMFWSLSLSPSHLSFVLVISFLPVVVLQLLLSITTPNKRSNAPPPVDPGGVHPLPRWSSSQVMASCRLGQAGAPMGTRTTSHTLANGRSRTTSSSATST